MTVKQYRAIWLILLNQKFKQSWELAVKDKLSRLKFDRHGQPKPGRLALYAKDKFPTLLDEYRIRVNCAEVPKRRLRTKTEHHQNKKQLSLLESNQLDLF